MTLGQVKSTAAALAGAPMSYVSVFAGRIADTGRNPVPLMTEAMKILRPYPHLQLIWASPRELLNLIQADNTGCHVITVTQDLLKKLPFLGKDLDEFSLDTVRMFYNDAVTAGFTLELKATESIHNLASSLAANSPSVAPSDANPGPSTEVPDAELVPVKKA
jgi:transaldolase